MSPHSVLTGLQKPRNITSYYNVFFLIYLMFSTCRIAIVIKILFKASWIYGSTNVSTNQNRKTAHRSKRSKEPVVVSTMSLWLTVMHTAMLPHPCKRFFFPSKSCEHKCSFIKLHTYLGIYSGVLRVQVIK